MTTPADGSALGYADLTPDEVLAALDAVGFHGDGRILQLNSYENRVFQVMLEDGSAVVVKFYRPGRWSNDQIVEEHRFALELEAAEVPVVAPLPLMRRNSGVDLLPLNGLPSLALLRSVSGTHRFAVAPRKAGRAPDLESDDVLRRLGGLIGRMHLVGSRQSFRCRPTMHAPLNLREDIQLLMDGRFVPEDQVEAWNEVCTNILHYVDAAWSSCTPVVRRIHGDCHRGNLLWRDEGAHLVDLDDSCNGPAIQDLWMLLSGSPDSATHQLGQLLLGYQVFCPFDMKELRLVEALRLFRMVRHSAWLAKRWSDPAFPRAFPGFGGSSYWAQQVMHLSEQLQVATLSSHIARSPGA